MADIAKNDWLSELEKAALQAANNRVDTNKKLGAYKMGTADPSADVEKYFRQYMAELKKKMPFEDTNSEDLRKLGEFGAENTMKWVDGNFRGPSPKDMEKIVESAKFSELLYGVAEDGKSWYKMGSMPLRLKGKELGYDTSTKEGFSEFLKKITEYQNAFDRAKLDKELREMLEYKVSSLFYPSAVKAIDNAVATGEGGDASDIAKLAALDGVTNAAIFMAPSASVLKASPVLNSSIDAILQGGAELARQYGANAIDDSIEADPSAAIVASTIGATRPAVVGAAQMYASRVPGKAARDVSRGIGKATRAGNPAMQERDRLIAEIFDYNKAVKRGELSKTREAVMPLNEVERYKKLFETKKMMEDLGIKAGKDGTYDIGEFMKFYDRQPVKSVTITPEGIIENSATSAKIKPSQILLGADNSEGFGRYFGSKVYDEMGNNAAAKVGLNIGRFLGDLGSRVEPMVKGNPLNIGPQTFKPYNMSDWYKKMKEDKDRIQASKIIDSVFSAK